MRNFLTDCSRLAVLSKDALGAEVAAGRTAEEDEAFGDAFFGLDMDGLRALDEDEGFVPLRALVWFVIGTMGLLEMDLVSRPSSEPDSSSRVSRRRNLARALVAADLDRR